MFFYDLFRVCLFWVKITSGNGDVWLVRKIEFSGNWFLLTEKKWLWLRKTFYIHFHFKGFLEREREREREQASAREEEDRAPVQSDDRRRTSSSSPRRSRELQSDDCDPSVRCFARSRSMLREIAPSIAISRRRSQSRLREIAPSIAVVGLEPRSTAPSNPFERRSLMIFFLGFFWVLSVFFWVCLFLLLFQTPENFFQKIFWNATKHMKTFSFPENSISEKWNIFRKCFYTNQTQPYIGFFFPTVFLQNFQLETNHYSWWVGP